jgi:hypothetical protein
MLIVVKDKIIFELELRLPFQLLGLNRIEQGEKS